MGTSYPHNSPNTSRWRQITNSQHDIDVYVGEIKGKQWGIWWTWTQKSQQGKLENCCWTWNNKGPRGGLKVWSTQATRNSQNWLPRTGPHTKRNCWEQNQNEAGQATETKEREGSCKRGRWKQNHHILKISMKTSSVQLEMLPSQPSFLKFRKTKFT